MRHEPERNVSGATHECRPLPTRGYETERSAALRQAAATCGPMVHTHVWQRAGVFQFASIHVHSLFDWILADSTCMTFGGRT